MVKTTLFGLAALLAAIACGGSPLQPSGPTVSSVAVQSGDLPKGMVKCDLSGDIGSFLAKEKTQDPTSYNSINTEWSDAKKSGATAAYVAFFTDTQSHCSAIKTNGGDIGTANYQLAINFVIQFKDEATAAKGYTNESIFGFSTSQLKQTGGVPVVEGSATGLGGNSIVLSAAAASQSYYIAVWQKKSFMVILALLNVDSTASKKVATSENSRIS
ncbi:MAG TPA: hypothetical protein VJT78_09265 [Candidatus Dormibacteraeota bacterium]|nr:hypothetical protein [Candidatus Dormibacteraeota bacterium]